MDASKTKTTVIQRHLDNELLQAPALSPMMRFPKDLAGDQPTASPNEAILAAAAQALEEGQTHYVDVPGIAPLREALAGFLSGMGIGGYDVPNVLVTAGMQEARFLTIQMIGKDFGCVALPEVVHPGASKAAGVRRIDVATLPVDADRGYLPTVAGIRAALEGGCKLIYLESPVRLTGAAFDAATVAEIAKVVRELDGAVIWDQGLAPWTAEYAPLAAQEGLAERVATMGEAWPGLGLESWLVGYVAANEDWWEPMRSQKQIMSICTSTASQFGAVKAAELYPDLHGGQVGQLAGLRDQAQAKASGQVIPGGAATILAFRPKDPTAAAESLTAAGFGFADGADFGAPGLLRLAVTPDNAIADALNHLS
jgi:aspartate/methionine/tyrosine aminotransferase